MPRFRLPADATIVMCTMLAVLAAMGLSTSTDAAIVDLQAAAQANPNLIHQYTFDGADDTARRADQEGSADLIVKFFGDGITEANIGYGVAGFDATSDAASTFRLIPGADSEGGAHFQTGAVTLGNAMSYEIVFQPSEAEIAGGTWNLGYILANRVDSSRGYMLLQGSAEAGETTGIDGSDLAGIIGTSFSTSNEQTIVETVQAGHWYYAAGTYSAAGDGSSTTFTNYIADLTAGDDTLTVVGPITVDGTYATEATPIGIGGRWDQGESFPGSIDEVNLYNTGLDGAVFQQHLSALTIPEPSTMALLLIGFACLVPMLRRWWS